jgi:hypothetical protein
MSTSDLAKLCDRVRSEVQEMTAAVDELLRGGTREGVSAVLDYMASDPDSHVTFVATNMLADEVLPVGIDLVLERLANEDLREGIKFPFANRLAYALGEVAHRQGKERDPRIVPLLLDKLKLLVETNSELLRSFVGALRECVRSGPIPEASAPIRTVLKTIREEAETSPVYFVAEDAAEILYANEGDKVLSELSALSDGLLPDIGMGYELREFLSKHEAKQSAAPSDTSPNSRDR